MSTILIVDDEPDVRFMLRLILENAGHEVVEAAHGAAALNLISPWRLPDLIVTDLAMPVLGGEELIGHLRSAPMTAAIPIVVVSGNAIAAWTLKAAGLIEAVVSKPFEADTLMRCVHAVASGTSGRSIVA